MSTANALLNIYCVIKRHAIRHGRRSRRLILSVDFPQSAGLFRQAIVSIATWTSGAVCSAIFCARSRCPTVDILNVDQAPEICIFRIRDRSRTPLGLRLPYAAVRAFPRPLSEEVDRSCRLLLPARKTVACRLGSECHHALDHGSNGLVDPGRV